MLSNEERQAKLKKLEEFLIAIEELKRSNCVGIRCSECPLLMEATLCHMQRKDGEVKMFGD